jgi:hypothetical protein
MEQKSSKKKPPKFARFSRIFLIKSPDFHDKFQYVAKNIEEGFIYLFINKIFPLSYLVCNQIWLNYFVNDHHFGYITKILVKMATNHKIECFYYPK